MNISLQKLSAAAQATGFNAEILEKVAQLLELLAKFQQHPYLKKKLALKGGTKLGGKLPTTVKTISAME